MCRLVVDGRHVDKKTTCLLFILIFSKKRHSLIVVLMEKGKAASKFSFSIKYSSLFNLL